MTLVHFRVDLPGGHSIGPGKIRLLELLEEQGSISAAARAMRMSYRQAWILLKDLNDSLGQPLFQTATGGRRGGGARLTTLGRRVVERYRTLAHAIDTVARRTLRGLIETRARETDESARTAESRARGSRKREGSAGAGRRKLTRHATSPRSGRRP